MIVGAELQVTDKLFVDRLICLFTPLWFISNFLLLLIMIQVKLEVSFKSILEDKSNFC